MERFCEPLHFMGSLLQWGNAAHAKMSFIDVLIECYVMPYEVPGKILTVLFHIYIYIYIYIYFGQALKHWRLKSTALLAFASLRFVCSIDLVVSFTVLGKLCRSSPRGISQYKMYMYFIAFLTFRKISFFHCQKLSVYIKLITNIK